MTSRPKKILFIGHSAGRTGAPIILLTFLQWLRRNDDAQFDVRIVEGGPLLTEFEAIASTEVLQREPAFAARVARRLMGRSRWSAMEDRLFARRTQRRGYDMVYVNTIAPHRDIRALGQTGIPIVCHVHELDFAMKQWAGKEGLAPLVPCIAHFIAASVAVRDFLVDRCAVPQHKVTTVHEFITLENEPPDSANARTRVRASLRLSDDDVLVGACGSLDWRKGADMFLQVARLTTADARGRNVHFLWLGAHRTTADYWKFMHDVHACGLDERVTVIENSSQPGDFFSAMDIFALTSREDPFPLVMLEAAAMGLPLVCFEGSGGGPEFADGGAGLIAPYLDAAAFAQHVLSLAGDHEARRRLGAKATRKVHDQYSLERQAPKLRDVISMVVGSRRAVSK
jgi:glycosyltransferase involved in cell wall biosynthesis